MNFKNKPALTLIELILVVSVFAILLAFVGPSLVQRTLGDQSSVAVSQLIHELRQARQNAFQALDQVDWGISLDSASSYSLVRGDGGAEVIYQLQLPGTIEIVNPSSFPTLIQFDEGLGTSAGTVLELDSLETDVNPDFTITVTSNGHVYLNN